MNVPARRMKGFSLLEVMIVVAIMGLLAAVALPQFTSHKEEARTGAMVSNLAIMRTAIDSYWSQHDTFPGPTAAKFTDQMLKTTNKTGKVGTTDDFGYGPYIRQGELPVNPYTGNNTVKVVDQMPSEPSGNQAWMYCPTTGEIKGNVTGKSPEGKLLFSL